jgi:tripartite ATP-independent transporter DctP family solute receptor
MLKQKLLTHVIALAGALLFSTASSAASARIDFATGFNGGDGQIGNTMRKFEELVEKRSNGEISVNLFTDAALGNERDILESLIAGSTAMSLAGISDVVYWLPKHFLSVPYLFTSKEHVRAVYDGEIGREIDKLVLEQKGIRTLSIMNRGARQLTSNRAIKTPDDVKGLRLRLPENPLWIGVWGLLQPVSTTVALSELYTALQTGVVEAQENPLESIVQSRLHEVQKYLVLTNHVRDVYKIQISEKIWAKLSPQQQQILTEAAKEAAAYGDTLLDAAEARYLEEVRASGVEIIEPDLSRFQQALGGARAIVEKHLQPGLYERVIAADPAKK